MKEGDYIGPYTCTADCNPPCDITWKYKVSTSDRFLDVASTGLLDSQIVHRSIAVFRCISKYVPDIGFKKIEPLNLMFSVSTSFYDKIDTGRLRLESK